MTCALYARIQKLEGVAEAALESLKQGEHDGPCDNADEDGTIWPESGPCEQHLATSKKREEQLMKALKDAGYTVKPPTL